MKTIKQYVSKDMIEANITNIFNCYQNFINNTSQRCIQIVDYEDRTMFFNFSFRAYSHLFGFNYFYLIDKYEQFKDMTSSKILDWVMAHKDWLVLEIINGNIDLSLLFDRFAYLKLTELCKIQDFSPNDIHFIVNLSEDYTKFNERVKPDYLLGIKNDDGYTLFGVRKFADQKQASIYSIVCLNLESACYSQIINPIKAVKVDHYQGDNDYYGSSYESTFEKIEHIKRYAAIQDAIVADNAGLQLHISRAKKLNETSTLQRTRTII